MDWTAPVDICCERLDASFWAEPLNAVSNLAFMISLTLRTFDLALCDVWPYGTHVFWHLLNGTMIALLLQALIRHTRKASTP